MSEEKSEECVVDNVDIVNMEVNNFFLLNVEKVYLIMLMLERGIIFCGLVVFLVLLDFSLSFVGSDK